MDFDDTALIRALASWRAVYSVTLRGQTAALRPSHHPHHHRTGFCAPRLSKGSSRLIINRPWILSSVAFANSHCALPYGPADAHCTLLFNAEFRLACPAAFERFRSSVLSIIEIIVASRGSSRVLPRSFACWAFCRLRTTGRIIDQLAPLALAPAGARTLPLFASLLCTAADCTRGFRRYDRC